MAFARNVAKRRKLTSFGEIPDKHVVTVLGEARADPTIAQHVSARTFHRSRAELAKEIGASISVGDIQLPVIDLARGLQAVCKTEPWSSAILATYTRRPCVDVDSAWRIVVYADEITPGNVMRLDHRRKALCLYVTFMEFDYEWVQAADLWLPIAICRNSLAKKLQGGYSNLVRVILLKLLHSSKVTEQGILLTLHDGTVVRIFAKGGPALFDGDAFRMIWSVKGSGGVMPCILCATTTSDASMVRPGLPFVALDEPCARKLRFATSAEIYRKADQLALLHADVLANRMTKGAFEEAQISRGIVYNQFGVLWDPVLRHRFPIAEVAWYDPMHNLIARGIVQMESYSLLQLLGSHGMGFDVLRRFVGASNWHVHSAHKLSTFRSLFSLARQLHFNRNKVFNPDAGDMLMAMPVILHFANSVAAHLPGMDLPLQSYRALRDIVLLCQRCKVEGVRLAGELSSAVERHLSLRNAAYPHVAAKPKHHFNHHLGPQLARLDEDEGEGGKLLDCFVGERKNCSLRTTANIVRNAKTWERSVLFRAMGAQLGRLQKRKPPNALLAPVSVSPCGAIRASSSATVRGMHLGMGDAIKVGNSVLVLRQAQFEDAHGLRLLCDAYESQRRMDSHAYVFVCTSRSVLVTASSFRIAPLYYTLRDGGMVVLD